MDVVPMKMTSLDIRKQEFKRVFRGLDPEEVMAFLETIADAFEELNRERLQALGNRAVEKARSLVRQMRSELVKLKSRRDMFIARFQSLLQAESDFLAQLSGDEFDGVDDMRTNEGDEEAYVKGGNGQITDGENAETED